MVRGGEMWKVLALAAVTMTTTACALDPADPAGDVEQAATYYPICSKHYSCCQDTKLGRTFDEPNKSRCAVCLARCRDEDDMRGRWPAYTHAGWECRYWKPEFWDGIDPGDCEDLPR
jgi:hypothetical protein